MQVAQPDHPALQLDREPSLIPGWVAGALVEPRLVLGERDGYHGSGIRQHRDLEVLKQLPQARKVRPLDRAEHDPVTAKHRPTSSTGNASSTAPRAVRAYDAAVPPGRSNPLRSVVALVAILVMVAGVPARAIPNLTGYPNSMASTGDSITRAYNTGTVPFTDAAANSWSTGGGHRVLSQYRRILAAEPAISSRSFNDAVTGARVVDLEAQIERVNEQGVAYVTILIGANDLCTRTVEAMTSAAEFRSRFEDAMAALSAGSPRARIYVVSIPDVYRLWTILHDSFLARLAWRTFGVCRSLLERPRSEDAADMARREAVRQRTVEFNAQLAEVCALYIHCRFDQNAVFTHPFRPQDVSRRDYFHPSLQGQERLAEVTWSATFDFADVVPPVSAAATTIVEGGILVSLDASDDVGVSGIEYRLDLGAWQRYVGPFVLASGSGIRFRAVDVNGNTEATRSLTG